MKAIIEVNCLIFLGWIAVQCHAAPKPRWASHKEFYHIGFLIGNLWYCKSTDHPIHWSDIAIEITTSTLSVTVSESVKLVYFYNSKLTDEVKNAIRAVLQRFRDVRSLIVTIVLKYRLKHQNALRIKCDVNLSSVQSFVVSQLSGKRQFRFWHIHLQMCQSSLLFGFCGRFFQVEFVHDLFRKNLKVCRTFNQLRPSID